jgi:hypothetical protein
VANALIACEKITIGSPAKAMKTSFVGYLDFIVVLQRLRQTIFQTESICTSLGNASRLTRTLPAPRRPQNDSNYPLIALDSGPKSA